MTHSMLVLGAGKGWHANQIHDAARKRSLDIHFADYESLTAHVETNRNVTISAKTTQGLEGDGASNLSLVSLQSFDSVLTRTMPAGSLETITFRLANLHHLHAAGGRVVNPPRALELAIDKYATLAEVARLGYRVPETIVVQNANDALAAYDQLGGDVVVKPIFGGEGRGVMRIQDRQLAWTTFRTLEQLQAVLYVQRFILPGGIDRRCLILGNHAHGVRRTNPGHFQTNMKSGATCESIELEDELVQCATHITKHLGLRIASVDFLDSTDGDPVVVEVNAIPGWQGTQRVVQHCLADQILDAALP